MAAEIKTSLSVVATLVPASRGIFDVVVDDKLVYSKYETGQFPDNESLVATLLADNAG